MSKIKSLIKGTKKAAGSLVLLLVFLLPLFLGGRWVYEVSGGIDPRKVYSKEQINTFASTDEFQQTDIEPFSEGVVTVTFDDGWETVYSQGFKILESYGIDSTQYVLGGRFEDYNYLSEAQILSMQYSGHDIASHTMTHADLTKLEAEELSYEVGEADRSLSEKFGQMTDFASPLGASNDNTLAQIKKYYRSHRNTMADTETIEDLDINTRSNFNIYNINAFTVRRDTKLTDIKRLIDYTKKRKGWLILTYHQVDENDYSDYAVSPEILKKHMQLIRECEMPTTTIREFLDAYATHSRFKGVR